jgi:hypothetical protein
VHGGAENEKETRSCDMWSGVSVEGVSLCATQKWLVVGKVLIDWRTNSWLRFVSGVWGNSSYSSCLQKLLCTEC